MSKYLSKSNIGYLGIGRNGERVDWYWAWNPGGMGCSRGCDGCWARKLASRMACPDCRDFKVHMHEERLPQPANTKKPGVVLVNFTCDTFDEARPHTQIDEISLRVRAAPQHAYVFLTKNPHKAHQRSGFGDVGGFAGNVHLGLTIRHQADADAKLPTFLQIPGNLWLSIEPLSGPIDLTSWLDVKYNASHEIKTQRRDRIRGGAGGPVGDRPARPDMADGVGTTEPLGRHNSGEVQAASGGTRRRGLSPSIPADSGAEGNGLGESACVPTPARADTGTTNGEPPEREEEGQPAQQPRVGDTQRADASREECSGATGDHGRPRRRAEPCVEAHGCPSAGDAAPADDRADVSGVGGSIRGGVSDRVGHCSGEVLALRGCIIGQDNRRGAPGTETLDHIRRVAEDCRLAGIPVFIKQIHYNGKLLRASKPEEFDLYPADLKVRDLPWSLPPAR